MTAISDWIQDNWKAIECTTYSSLGLGAYGAAFTSLFTPAAATALGWTAIGGAFELAYNLAGCNGEPPPGPPPDGGCAGNCWEMDAPADMYVTVRGQTPSTFPVAYNVRKIRYIQWDQAQFQWVVFYTSWDGDDLTYRAGGLNPWDIFCAYLQGSGNCIGGEPIVVPPHAPEEPIGDPTVHQDGECIWTITPIDAYVDASGMAHIYYRAEPNDEACGDPYEFWSSDQGPRFVRPNPDSPDPTPPPYYQPDPEPVTSNCPDPCKDYDGEFAAIMAKLAEIQECACKDNDKVTLDGDWISTRWVSDSTSANSNNYLRKLFRYRSKSTRTDDQLQTYWSDFTWQAGSVCVIHKGAWWGTPQVWAASESEGQRVIRFAAGEAGIDPDQTGEWLTRSSSSPRIGMTGRMRLQEEQGMQWVTRREGASSFPEL